MKHATRLSTRSARPARFTLSARSSRTIATTAALATATLLAGCGGSDEATDSGASDPAPASSAEAAPATVDTMFGEVTVAPPEDGELTVVALGWSDAEMALAVGVKPVATFDWGGFGAQNKGVGPWATGLFEDVDPEIIERGDESLNYEQIQALDPDLILNTRSGNDEEEFDRLTEIAPTVFGPKGTGAYATEWRDQMTLVGQAVGKPDEADAVIEDVDAEIAATAAEHPEFDGLTIASMAKFGDAYGAYLPGDGRFDLVGELGFDNNPPITKLKSSGFFANVSVENVAVADADVAVILPLGFTLKETQDDSLLSSLDVVKEDRAVYLDPDSELTGAWGAASALSIPVVLDELTPELAKAAEGVGS